MPKTDILFYSPLNMRDFIDFCVMGRPTGPTSFEVDEDGRDIRGVMSWLHGWRVQEAQFFHTPPDDDGVKLFMAFVQKHNDDDPVRPWFITDVSFPPKIILDPHIPGIDKVLRVDGELGVLDEPKSINELLGAVTQDHNLEAEFATQKQRVKQVLKQLEQDKAGTNRFLAALRGEGEMRPAGEVFKELNFSLRG